MVEKGVDMMIGVDILKNAYEKLFNFKYQKSYKSNIL